MSNDNTKVACDVDVLSVEGITVSAVGKNSSMRLVDDVSVNLKAGKITALAGESGSGKTVTAMAILGLSRERGTRIDVGDIRFDGRSLVSLTDKEMHTLRGVEIGAVFQDPTNSIDPMYTIGNSLREVIRTHNQVDALGANRIAIQALRDAGIDNAEERMDVYPSQLSGGLLQRVMLALAIVLNPKVIIADEPTTALDVIVQARVMRLIRRLADRGTAVLFVTHDLGLVSEYADEIHVMYAGHVVESGPVHDVLKQPKHPYTSKLIEANPSADIRTDRLATIPALQS